MLDFFRWLWNQSVKAALWVLGIPGAIVAAFTGFTGFVAAAFQDVKLFQYLADACDKLQSVISWVSSQSESSESTVQLILHVLAIDAWIQDLVVLVLGTLGVLLTIAVGFLLILVPLIAAAFSIRFLCKLIQTASIGFADP